LAARFPGAETLEQFWDNLVGGVESIRRFSSDELAQAGGTDAFGDEELVAVSGALDDVESFDAAFFGLSAREAELTDPAQRLFLEVCQQALEHGGHAGASGRIGIFAGSGMNLYTQQNQSTDYLATRVAYRLGLTGPAIGVQAAWSSSLVAVHLACQALRSGDADLALAGAAAVHVPQATGYHASPGSILSPSGHVRAFDYFGGVPTRISYDNSAIAVIEVFKGRERKLTVGATAKLTADIIAGEVIVYGSVKGNVRGKGKVEIKKDGSVNGDLTTVQIIIEDGAYFKGSIEIEKSAKKEAHKDVFSRTASASATPAAGAGPKSS